MRFLRFFFTLLPGILLVGREKYGYLLVLLILQSVSCAVPAIYVATNGDDLNAGTRSYPVASLNKAIELSRLAKTKKIIIGEGHYYNVSVILSVMDSGLQISGQPGKEVYLYGGKPLKNWRTVGKWFVADVPGTYDRSWDFRILIVNDSIRPRARLPEIGVFVHQNKWPYEWQSSQGGWSKKPTNEELTTLYYNPKDLGSWLNTRNAELTIFHSWDDSYVGLQSIDTLKHSLTFTYPSTHPAGAFASGVGKASSYIVWNIKEGMKHPGQWYLDRTVEKIFYWPYPDEKISDIEALVPTQNQVFVFEKGTHNMKLENLKISCVGAPMSNPGYGTGKILGAIQATEIDHLTLRNISINNVAGWSIKVKGSFINISDGVFSNTGAGGISYRGTNNRIERCLIHDVGRLYYGSAGIGGGGKKNTISHCELYNIPYAAINGMGSQSLAEYNLIYNFKLELVDGGAIYDGSVDSTIYRNNAALFKNNNTIIGWTYYFDELSKNCIIENNLAINTISPVHNHMAHDIIIRNNLLIDQRKQFINSYLCSNICITGNTFVADTIIFVSPTGEPLSKDKASYNYIFQKYYNANGMVEFKGNKLYCDTIMKAVLHMYDTNRFENFDSPENIHISNKNKRQLLRDILPEEYGQTGYRKNFSEVFKEMTSD
ncbi:MAG: hypothetical protein M0R39_16230 [Prolixibacteraceae bacterium]|nr:hypothetical protein [Prolixibacteraceae bacterium]